MRVCGVGVGLGTREGTAGHSRRRLSARRQGPEARAWARLIAGAGQAGAGGAYGCKHHKQCQKCESVSI